MTGPSVRALALCLAGALAATASWAPRPAGSQGHAPSARLPATDQSARGEDSAAPPSPDSAAIPLPSWLPSWISGVRPQAAAPGGRTTATAAGSPAGPSAEQAAESPKVPIRVAAGPDRGSLVALLEPLWMDLTAAQQRALAPFAPEWNTWPTAEKKSWVALADKLPAMAPDLRAKAQQRIVEWANLSPAQRRLARQNYRLAKERSAQERVVEWQNYQSMTQDQQTVLRHAGSTSNTAAGHAGAANGLAKEASQPLPRDAPPPGALGLVPTRNPVRSPAR